MPLQEQVIPLSFSKGLETKMDPKQIPAGNLLTLENGVFINPQEIIKRNGYQGLSNSIAGGGTITSGNSLALLNKNLVMTDSSIIYSYLEKNQDWHYGGNMPSTKVAVSSLVGNANGLAFPQSLTNGNYKVTLSGSFESNFTHQLVVSDPTSGNPLITNTFDTPTTGVNILAFGLSKGVGAKFIYYVLHADGAFYLYSYDAVSNTRALLFSVASSNIVSPKIVTDSAYIYLLLCITSDLSLYRYDITTGTLVNTTTVDTQTTFTSIDMILDSINSELVLFYSYVGDRALADRYTTALTFIDNVYDSGVIAQPIHRITGVINQTALFIIKDIVSLTDTGEFYLTATNVKDYRTSPTTKNVSTDFAYGTKIISNPVIINGTIYIATASVFPTQNTEFVIGYSPTATDPSDPFMDYIPMVGGKFAYEVGYFDPNGTINLLGLIYWNGQLLPFLTATHISPSSTGLMASYGISELQFSTDEKLTSVTLGQNINYVGASPSLFDGNGVAEIGYDLFPVIKGQTGLTAGTQLSFNWIAIFTWVDFQGNLHRSAPSIPFNVLTDTDPSSGTPAVLTVTGLGLTSIYKMRDVQIQLYRTAANATTYYLVGTAMNNPVGLVSISDSVPSEAADSPTLQFGLQLYTTGGELENITPPATDLMTSFKNRVILVDSENPLQWYYSKQVLQGFPPEFSDVLVQNIDQKGGPITALSTMDDKLIFFKESNVWYVIGDGPSPNGLNNDFTYPQIISSDTGCINQSSIVLTPSGLFFQSPKGIYLLGRDLSLNYVGASVERYNSATITSAQMIASTNQIRFTLNTGIALVYDYFMQQWSVFTNLAAVDAIIYNGVHTYIQSTGEVDIETPGIYADPSGTSVQLSLTTGWLSFAGLQGFERVKQFLILGQSESLFSNLAISLAYDFDPTVTQVNNIPVSGIDIPYQYRVFTARQKCQSIQLTITESQDSQTEGLKLSGLAFNVAQKKGPYKLPAASTYG